MKLRRIRGNLYKISQRCRLVLTPSLTSSLIKRLGRRHFKSSGGMISEPRLLDPAEPGTDVLRGSGVRSRITSILGVSGALISGSFISGLAPVCNEYEDLIWSFVIHRLNFSLTRLV